MKQFLNSAWAKAKTLPRPSRTMAIAAVLVATILVVAFAFYDIDATAGKRQEDQQQAETAKAVAEEVKAIAEAAKAEADKQATADRQAAADKLAALAKAIPPPTSPTSPSVDASALATPKSAAAPAPTPASTSAAITTMNVVHKGEGREHPMIRQLMADPDILAEPGDDLAKIGVKPFTGDRDNDKAAFKHWAGVMAHILETASGGIGPKFHEEIRVKAPETIAVRIEKDPTAGTILVVTYSVTATQSTSPETATTTVAGTSTATTNTSFTATQVVSQTVATTLADAHFIGPQDGTTALPAPYNQFEYMYVG